MITFIYVCTPRGLTKTELTKTMNEARVYLYNLFKEEELAIIRSWDVHVEEGEHIPSEYVQSEYVSEFIYRLTKMNHCYAIYFTPGWKDDPLCRELHDFAIRHEMSIVKEDETTKYSGRYPWGCSGGFTCHMDPETIKTLLNERYGAPGESDNVHHPTHYQILPGVEVIDIIRALEERPSELTGFQEYCRGNIIKYILRAEEKNGPEDYKKAKVYLDWLIADYEEEE